MSQFVTGSISCRSILRPGGVNADDLPIGIFSPPREMP
ncbi:hypothetical protein D3OALGA1CA_3021 [Olavius algarvensis associated proteobacterium Delta 3]|nr:hypothetical protein D3OALGA1CA_3021 [Olavius algarvensis associated proteobacterium Delta 3]